MVYSRLHRIKFYLSRELSFLPGMGSPRAVNKSGLCHVCFMLGQGILMRERMGAGDGRRDARDFLAMGCFLVVFFFLLLSLFVLLLILPLLLLPVLFLSLFLVHVWAWTRLLSAGLACSCFDKDSFSAPSPYRRNICLARVLPVPFGSCLDSKSVWWLLFLPSAPWVHDADLLPPFVGPPRGCWRKLSVLHYTSVIWRQWLPVLV